MKRQEKEKLMKRIRYAHRSVGSWRRYAVSCAAAVAVIGSAFAAANIFMEKTEIAEGTTVEGTMETFDEDGSRTGEISVFYDGAGMILTFTGERPEGQRMVKFRPAYTPEASPAGYAVSDGWYTDNLTGEGDISEPVPWQIDVYYPKADTEFVILGDVSLVEEGSLGSLLMTKVSVIQSSKDDLALNVDGERIDLAPPAERQFNNIFLFDQENGHMIRITGALPFEELDRIASGLEISLTDSPAPEGQSGIGLMNNARG